MNDEHEQVLAEAAAIRKWIADRPLLHQEAMGMALVAKNAPEAHIRIRAQKRFEEIYAYAAESLGIKI